MYRAILAFSCVLLCFGTLAAADSKVTLKKEGSGLKVLVGDDVFTVFRFEKERRKPFFYPVSAAGGFARLTEAAEKDPAESDARKVIVVSDAASLSAEGRPAEPVPFGTILTVAKVDGNKVLIADRNAWLDRSDIVPLASTLTRVIQDEPHVNKDRKSPDFYDHPHHKGIWFAVDEINGIKFWMEESLVVTRSVEIVKNDADSASFSYVCEWLDKENQPVLEQKTLVTISNDRLISFDATLIAAADKVHIGDTKEGMFAIRFANSMPEKLAGGPVTTSEGITGANSAWGKTARWINYVGPVQGQKYAVTIMDSTDNPWASRYHVRDYGLFSVNPFGAASYTEKTADAQPAHAKDLKKGDSLRFRYGLWVHDAADNAQQIQDAYTLFVKTSGQN